MSALAAWVNTSPADDFWFVAVSLVFACAGSFGFAFYFVARKRIMQDTPTSKIRSAAQGYVELNGHGELMSGPPIIAPLTGKHCTWYSFTIDKHQKSGKNSNWATIDSATSEELFLIVDETGQCVIDPEGASVTTAEKDVWYGSTTRPSRGPKSGGSILMSGKYRYTERRLRPAETLYAIGLFSTVGGAGDVFYPDSDVRDLLKEWKQNSQAMLEKFDTNKDGEIDIQEWQAVREAALKDVLAKHNERKTEEPVHMLARTRDSRRPFLLSALPQDSLARRYHFYSLGLITLFFISGAFATWAITLRLTGA